MRARAGLEHFRPAHTKVGKRLKGYKHRKRHGRSTAAGVSGNDSIEHAGCFAPAAPTEKKMKRNLSRWRGLVGLALMPAVAQTLGATGIKGKIQGHVTSPTGAPQGVGS